MAEGGKAARHAKPARHAHPHPVDDKPKTVAPGGNALAAMHAAAVAPKPAAKPHSSLVEVAPGGVAVNEIGIVAWDRTPELRLRSTPNNGSDDNIIGTLPFNTHVQVMQSVPGDWVLVATLDGKIGYCARTYVWYPPAHKLPEPNAVLHKVESGESGFAINIAQHYYGSVADKWGADLRFYVNVLGAVNHLDVPNTVSGWKTVQFPADRYIWIPSIEFARTLHGVLNSGSYSYEIADALGIAGFLERLGQLLSDFKEAIRLSGKYIPDSIAHHVEASAVAVLESLLQMAVIAIGVLAVTTAIGGLFGSAPGAAAGFEVGMVFLDWLGLGFLVAWIGSALVRIGSAFGDFLSDVWNARGDAKALDAAAQSFAEAIGTLCGVLVEALAMWALSFGLKKASAKLADTALGKQFGESELGDWLQDRINGYKARSNVWGPKETFKQLRDWYRRGKGDDAPPPGPVDVWTDLAQRHNLDADVVAILRDIGVDPSAVDRLLGAGMDQYEIGNLALDHGADGVRAADRLVRDGTSARAASRVISTAKDMGISREVIEMINSGKLENLRGLRNFLDDVAGELSRGQRGKYNQLMEAHDRAMGGNRVSLEGRQQVAGDAESGKADVVDYERGQAIQMKTVTGATPRAVVDNLQSAIDQVAGRTGETPPAGFQRIADIRLDEGMNPLRFMSREQLVAALRGQLDRLETLSPPGAAPGLIRITNAIGRFIINPAELR